MTPEELNMIISPSLRSDFANKVAQDIYAAIKNNESTYFEENLPTGLGSYLCLQPLAAVMHAVLETCVNCKIIHPNNIGNVVDQLCSDIKEGIEPKSRVNLPSD